MISASHLQLSLPLFPHRRSAAPLRYPVISAAYPTIAGASPAVRSSATPPPPSSLYDILGLEEKATAREIKAAYRSLARTCHPDVRSGTSADEFLSVHAAYATLSDPAKRAVYDRELMALRPSPSWSHRFSDHARRRTWETDQCW